MESNSIMDKEFNTAMNGYKREEVRDFLSDVAREFSHMKKETEDLERKLQVCTNKIREYREDEDALKDALLGAQKQGNSIISESKQKGAKIISDAEEKSTKMMEDADEYVAKKKAEAEKIIADAMAEKKRIEDEARKQKDDIHAQMMIQTELDKEVLARTKREAEDFRTRIIIEYNNHIEFIKNIPEQCENEFVRDTYKDHDTNVLRGLIASQQGVQMPDLSALEKSDDDDESEDDSDVKVVDSYSEIDVSGGESEEIEEEDETDEDDAQGSGGLTVESAFGSSQGGQTLQNSQSPDFLNTGKSKKNSSSRYDKLEFGSSGSSSGSGQNYNKKKKRY